MREIRESVNLCDENGKLNPNAIGWARKPLYRCNLKGHFFRKKRWNYWAVYDSKFLFSATISNIDYLNSSFCYFLDFAAKDFFEKTFIAPFSLNCNISNSIDDEAIFSLKDNEFYFTNKDGVTFIDVSIPDTPYGKLEAKISIFCKNTDSLNVVIPWSNKRFQYTSKHMCLPAEGFIKVGNKEHKFKKEETFATFDFGRGVWKYSTFWNWGSFSCRLKDGNAIGVNLGGKWTDGTGMNENAMIVNGKLTKIFEDVIFEYDRVDFMKPWHIFTKGSDIVDLVISPFFERKAKTNLLLVNSEFHQIYGYVSGHIKDGFNNLYTIEDIVGWVEQHMAKW